VSNLQAPSRAPTQIDLAGLAISEGDQLIVRSVVAARTSVALTYDRTRSYISVSETGGGRASAVHVERSRSCRYEAFTTRIHYDTVTDARSLLDVLIRRELHGASATVPSIRFTLRPFSFCRGDPSEIRPMRWIPTGGASASRSPTVGQKTSMRAGDRSIPSGQFGLSRNTRYAMELAV
jgi:hypothetical protein